MAKVNIDQTKKLTIGDLKKILASFKRMGSTNDNTEIWLSSDEEGNSFSPLMQFKNGMVNIGTEEDQSRITLYPSSSHTEYDC